MQTILQVPGWAKFFSALSMFPPLFMLKSLKHNGAIPDRTSDALELLTTSVSAFSKKVSPQTIFRNRQIKRGPAESFKGESLPPAATSYAAPPF